ncbi:MAG: DsbA family oxidoreductase [Cyanobacteria bacterium P01_D01_bin.50]
MTITIEITSDFICPWCLVAETRLNKAIAQLNNQVDIQHIWYPFELNPHMPEMGMERKTYRTQKFGSWEYSQQLDGKTIKACQDDGIKFRYDLMEVTPNTHKAHRLTWFAAQQGKATEMAERIFRAYFTEGQDISPVETLTNLAVDIGIDRDRVQTFLQSNAGSQKVRELERQAVSRGIRGVPSIRIREEILSGAQPVEVFLSALQKAVNELVEV